MNGGESRCNSRGKEAELIAGEKFKAPDGRLSLMLVAEKDNFYCDPSHLINIGSSAVKHDHKQRYLAASK